MINTIISKSAYANSMYTYKKIEENLDNKQKAFLIVPEQYTLQSDINLIDNISYNTAMDAKVLSLSLIHISEPTRRLMASRMPSSA